MKYSRMWLDTKAVDNPQGTTRKNFNIIRTSSFELKNERGFDYNSVLESLPNVVIGVVDGLDDELVIFSISAGASVLDNEIGIIDKDNNYTAIVNARLGFNQDFPIIGEVKENVYGEKICAFTDRGNLPPFVINLDNPPDPFDINKILMFPESDYSNPTFSISDSGGVLRTGAYFMNYAYVDEDGTVTNPTQMSKPLFIVENSADVGYDSYIGSEANIATSKSINVNLVDLDSRFNKVRLYVATKIDGVFSYYEFGDYSIDSSLSVDIIVDDLSDKSVLSFEEVAVVRASFSSIKALTQSNNTLYIGNVTETEIPNYQKYANNIKLKWTTDLIYPNTPGDSTKFKEGNHDKRTLAHFEVYAIYIHLIGKDGNVSEGFHIPGDVPRANIPIRDDNGSIRFYANSDDLISDVKTTATTTYGAFSWNWLDRLLAIDANAKVFHLIDTADSATREMGFWENETETYPSVANDPDGNFEIWDSGGATGSTLHGQNVRHHRMPSIENLKRTIYSATGAYGQSALDLLGLEIDPTTLYFPPEVLANCQGYMLSIAERTPYNSTTLGSDLSDMFSRAEDALGNPNNANNINFIQSTGGNWNIDFTDSTILSTRRMRAQKSKLRLHNFDLLHFQPEITPSYIRNELRILWRQVSYDFGKQDGTRTDSDEGAVVVERDSKNTGTNSQPVPVMTDVVRKIDEFSYLPGNTIAGDYDNRFGEGCMAVEIEGGNLNLPVFLWDWDLYIGGSGMVFSYNYLMTVCRHIKDIYANFFEQNLVIASKIYDFASYPTSANPSQDGDVFTTFHSYWNYGVRHYNDLNTAESQDGIKTGTFFLGEFVSNPFFRYVDSTKYGTKFLFQDANWVETGYDHYRDQSPNNWQYNKDYSSIRNLHLLLPYNPFDRFETEFPHRIYKSIPDSETVINWKTFLINDYHDRPRNKGAIVAMEEYGNEIYIQQEYDLAITVGSTSIKTDQGNVYTTTGEIFEVLPQSVIIDKQGYIGCQHAFAVGISNEGYFCLDAQRGKVFLVRGKTPQEISLSGLKDFFELNTNGLEDQDNPFNKGFLMEYDAANNRVLLTRKDYTLTPAGLIAQGLGHLFRTHGEWRYDDGLTSYLASPENTPAYFDVSSQFTVSFSLYGSPESRGWISFHGYYPDMMIQTRNRLVSFKYNNLHEHNSRTSWCRYHKFPTQVEATIQDCWIAIPFISKFRTEQGRLLSAMFISVSWYTELENANGDIKSNATIDKIFSFNSYQATKEDDIVPYDTSLALEAQLYNHNTRNMKNTWAYNQLYDIVVDRLTKFVEDYSPVAGNIDDAKDFYTKGRMIDKFMVTKFLYSNEKISNLQCEITFLEFYSEQRPVNR